MSPIPFCCAYGRRSCGPFVLAWSSESRIGWIAIIRHLAPHAFDQDQPMADPSHALTPADWGRICDALRYLGRDLHHRSFAVTAERRLIGSVRT